MSKLPMKQGLGVLGNFGAILITGALVAIGFYIWQRSSESNVDGAQQETESIVDKVTEQQQDTYDQDQPIQSLQTSPVFEEQQLQAVVDDWAIALSGESSVVIADINGARFATHNPERVYFAASLYKLYVAYFGYKQIDDAVVRPDELYLGSRTRTACLDAMIRESDSPCAEKMWVEIGKQNLTDSLLEKSILNTSMVNLSTTAGDVVDILSLFASDEGLSDESQAAFLASAKDQIFRDALNKGFSSSLTVYNKVGFNELKEYHDVAIVELPDGRRFIIAVLTENVGTRNIAELARRIEEVILE